MGLFTDLQAWEVTLSILDAFSMHGVLVLHAAALAILQLHEFELLKMDIATAPAYILHPPKDKVSERIPVRDTQLTLHILV